MRKRMWILSVGALAAVAAVASAFTQSTAKAVLERHAQALAEAQSLRVEYTVQSVGGAPAKYSVALAKPNLLRLESDAALVVSNGKEIVTYDKKEKTYVTQPLTDALLASALEPAEWAVWAPFFAPRAMEGAKAVRLLGQRVRKGTPLVAAEIDWPGKMGRATLYADPRDGIVRQAEWTRTEPSGSKTVVMDARSLIVGGTVAADAFAFRAPEGSRQVTLEELNALKWLTDFDQALALASKTGKYVFVDFYTDWCVWCKELRKNVFPTAEFKAMAKHFVFVEIDAEAKPALAQAYGVDAYPTCVIADSKGALVHKIVGYKEKDAFVAEMKRAIGLR
ncbi:MAG: thioredoxin family protein [Fimbriimonadales bacterium]